VLVAAPQITQLVPGSANTENPPTLTLTGTDFLPGSTITFAGVTCTLVSLNSTQAQCRQQVHTHRRAAARCARACKRRTHAQVFDGASLPVILRTSATYGSLNSNSMLFSYNQPSNLQLSLPSAPTTVSFAISS
jgi:hypothetical protein